MAAHGSSVGRGPPPSVESKVWGGAWPYGGEVVSMVHGPRARKDGLGIAHQINVHHTKRYVSSVHINDQTVCDKQSRNGDEHDTDYHGNSIAKGCRKHAQAGLTLWDEFWIMKTNVIIKIRNKCV